MKKRWKQLILVLLLLCMVVPFGGAVSAEDDVNALVQEANRKIAELAAEKLELENRLNEIGDEVERSQERAASYARRVQLVEEQIDLINENIQLLNEEIVLKQELIDELQRQYEENYALFRERVRVMYMNNTASPLSVLLGVDSFSEFLIAADTLERISAHDTRLINEIFAQMSALQAAKQLLEEQMLELETQKAELEAKYSELAALYREANASLSEAEALQNATQEDYDEILAEYNAQLAIIDSLMGEASDVEYVGGYYTWPVPNYGKISSPYGWRILYGKDNFHAGIDIAGGGIWGKPVIASNTGQVTTAYYGDTGYGIYIIVDHGGGYKTLYGHLSAIYVRRGDWVAQGETIGAVGSTGNSTGPHLHFEIRINGQKIDPMTLVQNRPAV